MLSDGAFLPLLCVRLTPIEELADSSLISVAPSCELATVWTPIRHFTSRFTPFVFVVSRIRFNCARFSMSTQFAASHWIDAAKDTFYFSQSIREINGDKMTLNNNKSRNTIPSNGENPPATPTSRRWSGERASRVSVMMIEGGRQSIMLALPRSCITWV